MCHWCCRCSLELIIANGPVSYLSANSVYSSRAIRSSSRLNASPARSDAVSVAVGSTGSFKHLETHELLNQDQLTELLASARECRRRYQPPRQPITAS